MMVRILLFQALLICFLQANSQQSRIYADPQRSFEQAKEYYQNGQYNLAYPIFLSLYNQNEQAARSNERIASEELEFYTIATGLKRDEASAEKQAQLFVRLAGNKPLQQKISFQLAEFYFRQQDYRNAILMYEEATAANLSELERAGMDFRLGYGYFTLQQYEKAWGYLQRAANNPEGPYYADASYYYGYLVFNNKRYTDALDFFKRVDTHPQYGKVAPYYIASIYYQQGKKEEAISYAEDILKRSASASFDAGLKRLLGQAYFEKRLFSKALPYLESYMTQTAKPSREDLYQLSYSYFESRQFAKAITGFKELTDGQDSLSQSAMYLLGDAYLKTGQPENARNAFSFSARNNSNETQREISLFNYGKLSYELGYQDIAITELRSFLTAYPRSKYIDEGRELLVSVLAGTSNYREAYNLLESMPNTSNGMRQLYPRVLYGRAMELIGDEKLAEAEALLNRVITVSPNASIVPAVHFWKGELAYRQNRPADAIKLLTTYLNNPLENGEVQPTNARYTLGYALMRTENYSNAREQFDLISSRTLENANALVQDAFIRSADCSFMLKEFTKAKAKYNSAISASWPLADYATYQLAMIAGINNSDEKVRILQHFDKKYPASSLRSTVDLEVANALMADERFKEAIPYLQKLLNTESASSAVRPKAYLRLGIAYFNLDNNKEALKNYQNLVSEFPNAPEVEEALESAKAIYVEEGRTNDFVEFARSSGRPVSANEQDSLTYAAAETKLANGDQVGAINTFNTYLKQFPSGAYSIDAMYLKSDLLVKRKEMTQALEGFEKLVERAPNKYAEQASAQAARIYYFDVKNYAKAEQYFTQYKGMASLPANKLDAMRGLLRSQYQLKKWEEGATNANELLQDRSIGADDRILSSMMLGKFNQSQSKFADAINQFKTVVSLSKAAYAAEARYEIAASYYALNDLKNAEKSAFETINKSGSYDYWITKSYLLIADVFIKQKDLFNAKATLQSVAENSTIPELRKEAETKLAQIAIDEKK